MRKPVILVVENSVDFTGALNSVLTNSIVLNNEFDFVFVLPERSRAAKYVTPRFPVIEIPMLEISKSLRNILLYFPRLIANLFRLRRVVIKTRASLIVSNDFYNMLPPLYVLFGGNIPYITYVRFIPDKFPKTLVNVWVFFHHRFASVIIAVSNAVMKKLKPHAKVRVIYNELPTGNGFQFYDYDISSRTVLYVANYIPGKGLDYALRAFAALPEKHVGWQLRFIGSDMGLKKNQQFKASLKLLAEELGVAARIEWMDFKPSIVDEYKKASIVLNFSESESFSLTCAEAMYIGRPVIATRCGGPEEMITHGINGELVEVGNVEDMAASMEKLMSNHELRMFYSKTAHETIKENFCYDKTLAKLIPLYKNAILCRA